MALTPKQELERRKKALAWVKAILKKRRERVKYCHDIKVNWNKKARAADEEKRYDNAARARRKAAYWNELEDKAILGRAEFNQRRKRIEKKIKLLSVKVEQDNDLPAVGVSVPQRAWNPYGRTVANWIIPWLDKIWERGVRFVVVSGFRSDAYQCQVCASMCPGGCANGCPGRCAKPGTSNHRGSAYPLGAVDVTNYYQVEAALQQVGSPLHNSLGAQDPVHMSASGY